MSGVAGLILAGGQGSRLGGVRKSSVRIGGVRLLDRVIDSLGETIEPLMVATGYQDMTLFGLPSTVVAVADIASTVAGPLAGLGAAVDWLNAQSSLPEWIVSVAVDTPFLPSDFVDRLVGAMETGAEAGFSRYGDAFYPTNSIWRTASILELPHRIRNSTAPNSLKALLKELGAAPIDWQISAGGDPFANANTPQDLVALEQRALIHR